MSLLCVGLIGLFLGGDVLNKDIPGTYTLKFYEDLRIGDPTDPLYFWADGQSPIIVDANSKGHFFVADTQGNRILEYDTNGVFVRQVSGRGQGPGEYERLFYFHIFDDDSAIGLQIIGADCLFQNYGEGVIFESHERFLSPWSVADISFSPDGRWRFAFLFDNTAQKSKMQARRALLDRNMKVVRELGSGDIPVRNKSRYHDPRYWEEQIAGQFKLRFAGRSMVDFLPDGGLLFSDVSKYEVVKWSPDMQTKVWHMQKKYAPIPLLDSEIKVFEENLKDLMQRALPHLRHVITDNVVRKGVARAEPPDAKNPIYDIIPMEDNGFLVVHDYRIDEAIPIVDIFDKDGVYLGKAPLPKGILWDFNSFRIIFKNRYAYAARENEEGDHIVVRYRYRLEAGPIAAR